MQLPFSWDEIKLPLLQYAGQERDILVAMPVQQPRGDAFLFANSGDVKAELHARLSQFQTAEIMHPNALELAATIACLTFFERVQCEHPQRTAPKRLENDH